ncbi:hypothetical protein DIPPA_24831 [Diplonema papillatum]|nr:hypothetical protein DIPPA_24831 [Diplonema papillatum]
MWLARQRTIAVRGRDQPKRMYQRQLALRAVAEAPKYWLSLADAHRDTARTRSTQMWKPIPTYLSGKRLCLSPTLSNPAIQKTPTLQNSEFSRVVTEQQASAEADIGDIFAILHTTREKSRTAREAGSLKEMLRQTQAIRTLAKADKEHEAQGEDTVKKLSSLEGSLHQVQSSLDEFVTDVKSSREAAAGEVAREAEGLLQQVNDVRDELRMLTAGVIMKDAVDAFALKEELQDAQRVMRAKFGAVNDQVTAASDEREALARALQGKVDVECVASKMDRVDVESAVSGVSQRINRAFEDLDHVKDELHFQKEQLSIAAAEVARLASSGLTEPPSSKRDARATVSSPEPDAPSRRTSTARRSNASSNIAWATPADKSVPPDGARQLTTSEVTDTEVLLLAERVGGLESGLLSMAERKVDRGDLEGILFAALDHQYRRIDNPTSGDGPESTALRFRCLSCNRAANSLAMGDGMVHQNFPPSAIFGGKEIDQQRKTPTAKEKLNICIPSVTPGPSQPGQVSTTRRKLLEYYAWLRTKAEGRSSPVQLEVDDNTSTFSPKRCPSPTWDGAQSGGGEPRVRQCGDHGSPSPISIGTDGRFYAGVRSKGKKQPSAARALVAELR